MIKFSFGLQMFLFSLLSETVFRVVSGKASKKKCALLWCLMWD